MTTDRFKQFASEFLQIEKRLNSCKGLNSFHFPSIRQSYSGEVVLPVRVFTRIEGESENSKELWEGFILEKATSLSPFEQACCGALCEMLKGRDLLFLGSLGIREVENFLRDYNHVPAFGNDASINANLEAFVKKLSLSLFAIRVLGSLKKRAMDEVVLAQRPLAQRVRYVSELTQEINQQGWSSLGIAVELVDIDGEEVCFALDQSKSDSQSVQKMGADVLVELIEIVQSQYLQSVVDVGDRKVVAEAL